MDLSELRSRVYRELSEDANAFFSDEEIDDWLNEGQREIAIDTLFLKESKMIPLTTDEVYELPDDFIKEYKIVVDNDKLDDISMEDKDIKKGYYIWEQDDLTLSLVKGDNLYLYYYALPSTMGNDYDEPNLPLEHQKLLITYALLQAKKKDIEFVPQTELELLRENYAKGLNRIQQRYSRKPSSKRIEVDRI